MTVEELLSRMSSAELAEWATYSRVKELFQKQAAAMRDVSS